MGDDDLTPRQAPFNFANLPLLGVLSDLTTMADDHSKRLAELAAEVRRLRDPAGPEFISRMRTTLVDYHARAAVAAAKLGDEE